MTAAWYRDRVRIEAARRRAAARAQGSAAITRMLGRGETLETIAKSTGVGIGALPLMVVHTVHQEVGDKSRFGCTGRRTRRGDSQ